MKGEERDKDQRKYLKIAVNFPIWEKEIVSQVQGSPQNREVQAGRAPG